MDIACVEGDGWNLAQAVHALSAQGHRVEGFANARALLETVSRRVFDLYVVGTQLPDIGSEQLVLWLRSTVGEHIPMMALIPPEQDALVVQLLSAGADGCAASPVRGRELGARVGALLRRAYQGRKPGPRTGYGVYEFDMVRCRASCAGAVLDVPPRDLELAHYLFERVGQLVPKPVLEEQLWGKRQRVGSRSLDNMLSRVRMAFQLDGQHGFRLLSVYGQGVKLLQVHSPVAPEDAGRWTVPARPLTGSFGGRGDEM